MALTGAQRAAHFRSRHGAKGRLNDKIRKRHSRDRVRNDGDLASNSNVDGKTSIYGGPRGLLEAAFGDALARGRVDDYRAEALVLWLETLPRVKTRRKAGAWLKGTADNLEKADRRATFPIDSLDLLWERGTQFDADNPLHAISSRASDNSDQYWTDDPPEFLEPYSIPVIDDDDPDNPGTVVFDHKAEKSETLSAKQISELSEEEAAARTRFLKWGF